MRKVVGWAATIGLFLVLVVTAVAQQVLPEVLKSRLEFIPDWAWWVFLGLVAIGYGVLFLRPSVWRSIRASRAETQARRERLRNFEL